MCIAPRGVLLHSKWCYSTSIVEYIYSKPYREQTIEDESITKSSRPTRNHIHTDGHSYKGPSPDTRDFGRKDYANQFLLGLLFSCHHLALNRPPKGAGGEWLPSQLLKRLFRHQWNSEARDRFAPSLACSLSVPALNGSLGKQATLFGATALQS